MYTKLELKSANMVLVQSLRWPPRLQVEKINETDYEKSTCRIGDQKRLMHIF